MSLQLRVGGKYRTRDGSQEICITGLDPKSFAGNVGTYTVDGYYYADKRESVYDLVSEVLSEPATPDIPVYIYPGAEVLLRNGNKARVYAVDGGNGYAVHGALITDRGSWRVAAWDRHGKYCTNSTREPWDIVGPWVEPAKEVEVVRWAIIDKNGTYCGSYGEHDGPTDIESGRYLVKMTGKYTPRSGK